VFFDMLAEDGVFLAKTDVCCSRGAVLIRQGLELISVFLAKTKSTTVDDPAAPAVAAATEETAAADREKHGSPSTLSAPPATPILVPEPPSNGARFRSIRPRETRRH
jgi:hypothetical protein